MVRGLVPRAVAAALLGPPPTAAQGAGSARPADTVDEGALGRALAERLRPRGVRAVFAGDTAAALPRALAAALAVPFAASWWG